MIPPKPTDKDRHFFFIAVRAALGPWRGEGADSFGTNPSWMGGYFDLRDEFFPEEAEYRSRGWVDVGLHIDEYIRWEKAQSWIQPLHERQT